MEELKIPWFTLAWSRLQSAEAEHGRESPEAVEALLMWVRRCLLTPSPDPAHAMRAANDLVARATACHGPEAPITDFARGLAVIAGRDLDASRRRMARASHGWGADDPRTLELGGLAMLNCPDWPAVAQRTTHRRLAASPHFGPDHALTQECDRVLALEAPQWWGVLDDFLAEHGLLPAGDPVPEPGDVPTIELTVAQAQRMVPASTATTSYSDYLADLSAHLRAFGQPQRVFGPPVTFAWTFADGRLHLGADDVEYEGAHIEWTLYHGWLDATEVEEWENSLWLDSKAGEADGATYLWYMSVPDHQYVEGEFNHGGFEYDTWPEVRRALELSLDGLMSGLRLMPPEWHQSVEVEFTGPRTVSLKFDATTATLTVDDGVTNLSPADDDVIITLLDRAVEAMSGHEPEAYHREGRFTHARYSMITTG